MQRMHNQPDPLLIILMQEDTTKALRLVKNTQKIINIDKKLIDQYQAELNSLIMQQTELQRLYASLKQEEQALKKQSMIKNRNKEKEKFY